MPKCRCLNCSTENEHLAYPRWAVKGGVGGELVFSREAGDVQRRGSSSYLGIMPLGSGVCQKCYENPKQESQFALIRMIISVEKRDVPSWFVSVSKEEVVSLRERVESGEEPADIAADNMAKVVGGIQAKEVSKDPGDMSWMWPRTTRGWKSFVRYTAFQNEIIHDMDQGKDQKGKKITWFSATSKQFETGEIESCDFENGFCRVRKNKNGRLWKRTLKPSSLFPQNLMKQCVGVCYCPTCIKPKSCTYCGISCLSGEEGPGFKWYCRYHPVEKFFVHGTANKFEIMAWIEEDSHRRGEPFSVIDPESSLGIAVYGYPKKEVVLAECEGASITKTVEEKVICAKKDTCHECKKETYCGRICPSTGDTNWYCNDCWENYWITQKKNDAYNGDYPSLA